MPESSTVPKARGRPAQAKTASAVFFAQLLQRRNMTRAELAHRLGVDASTLTRFFNGNTIHNRTIDLEQLSLILGLDAEECALLSQHVYAHGTSLALISSARARRAATLEPDEIVSQLNEWKQTFREGARVQPLIPHVRECFDNLTRQQDFRPEMVRRRIDVGMFLACLREVASPWQTERPKIVPFYKELEEDLLSHLAFPGDYKITTLAELELVNTYARLLLRLAVLQREALHFSQSEETFRRLETFIQQADPLLQFAYRVQRLHLLAAKYDKAAWETTRAEIDSWLKFAPLAVRLGSEGVLEYIVGVGNKRFMWSAESSEDAKKYGLEALHRLTELNHHPQRGAPALIMLNAYPDDFSDERVAFELAASEIDILTWVEEDKAKTLERIATVRAKARELYPAVLHKLSLNERDLKKNDKSIARPDL